MRPAAAEPRRRRHSRGSGLVWIATQGSLCGGQEWHGPHPLASPVAMSAATRWRSTSPRAPPAVPPRPIGPGLGLVVLGETALDAQPRLHVCLAGCIPELVYVLLGGNSTCPEMLAS